MAVSTDRRTRTVPELSLPTLLAPPVQRALLVVAALAVLAQSALLILVPPPAGYEPSPVTAFPVTYWVTFGLGIATAVLVSVGSAVTRNRNWTRAVTLLLAQYALFFAIPGVRGYRLYGRGTSDSLYHLGAVRDLVAFGSLPGDVFYPFEHMLFAELVFFGVPVATLIQLTPFVFTVIYVLGVGVYLRALTGDDRALPLGIAAATPLYFAKFYTQLQPAVLSFMLFPVFLTFVERARRTNDRRYIGLVAVSSLALVFFHPVSALFFVIIVVGTVGYSNVYRRVTGNPVRSIRPMIALAIIPAAFMWYIGFRRAQLSLIQIFALAGETNPASQRAELASNAGLTALELVQRFVQLYGAVFLYFAVAGVFSLWLVRRLLKTDVKYHDGFLVTQFGIGAAVGVVFLGTYLIATGPIRIARYALVFATLLVGLSFLKLLVARGNFRLRVVGTAVLVVVVVAAALLGTFTVYGPNKHMTYSEYEGADFMLQYHNPDLPVRSFSLTVKTERYLSGGEDITLPRRTFSEESERYALTPGLGYDEYERASISYTHSYAATHEYDRRFLDAAYFTDNQREQLFLYDQSDIAEMDADHTVNRVYSNGGFQGWYIRWGEDKPNAATETFPAG
ncbi:hypothetical protein KU306_17700 (plasmid) [Haloferax larsenii]|uniref:Dolichyl-phosphate-mannose-protein mannosyltransferase n=1 Tax=Haloferax larsenii TaxID=302484 RepID=A0ABY5RJX0_HALLR|nr:hypothetical protein [Haloferax larsenii]UVE52444.1 hypothetical protein KU306_17700 [Haloferax larsenii]